jgi:hypothetical protein
VRSISFSTWNFSGSKKYLVSLCVLKTVSMIAID